MLLHCSCRAYQQSISLLHHPGIPVKSNAYISDISHAKFIVGYVYSLDLVCCSTVVFTLVVKAVSKQQENDYSPCRYH